MAKRDRFAGLVTPVFAEGTRVQREGEHLDSGYDDMLNGYGYGQNFALQTGGGFQNPITGLGTFGRDPILSGSFIDPIRISDPELSAMYNGYGLAGRIVETFPDMAMAKGYELHIPSDVDDHEQKLQNVKNARMAKRYAAGIRANELIRKSQVFANLFGGAILIAGLDDGQDPATPLRRDRIKSVKFLNPVDRRFLFALSYYGDVTNTGNYGEVETYRVTNVFGDQGSTIVHESRIIRFDGADVELIKKRQLAGWGYSKLQRPYDTLRQFGSSIQALANLLRVVSQGVFKIEGLQQAISQGRGDTMWTRLRIADAQRGALKSLVVDKDKEDFDLRSVPFAGIPESIKIMMQMVSADSEGIPLTKLFGVQTQGLGTSGKGDENNFYDQIRRCQEQDFEPRLQRLYDWIFLAKDGPTGGRIPEEYEIHWNPLDEQSPLEKAQTEQAIQARDVGYISAGVWEPEEVAISRAHGKMSVEETEINIDERKRALATTPDLNVMQEQAQLAAGQRQMQELSGGEPSNPQQAPLPAGPGNPSGSDENKKILGNVGKRIPFASQTEDPRKRAT